MPQFQSGGLNYIGGPPPDPFASLQNIMMMKMQMDKEEKEKQAQLKNELFKMDLEYKLKKQLIQDEQEARIKFNQQQLEQAHQMFLRQRQDVQDYRQNALTQLQRAYTDYSGRRPPPGQPFPLTEAGRIIMPIAQYGVNMGDPMSTASMAGMIKDMPNAFDFMKMQQAMEMLNKRLGTQENIAQSKIASQERITSQNRASKEKLTAQSLNTKIQMAIARNDIMKAIALIRQGGKADDKSKIAAIRMIESVAKNIAGGDEVTPETRARAIEQLATIEPEVFGQYLQAVEEEEPGWLFKITGGIFGGGEKTIKAGKKDSLGILRDPLRIR